MAKNPIRENLNRAHQIKSEKSDVKQSVSLFDIDYAMMTYLEDVALPTLTEGDGNVIKIPVVYGNSERWNGARREGIFRDIKGKIQLPIMMLRRTTITKDESMPMLNRHVSYSTVTKYSKDNRYDRFTLLGNTKPSYELYNITMPDYVEINYDCMVWTSFTEHLNSVIEQLNFTSSYWGDKNKFKFRTSIADYNVINEVGEGTERINRLEFTLNVKAYLLPEKFDGENTTKKSYSTKKVVFATEVDMTGNGRLEGLLTTPSPYYDNKDIIDWLSLNNSKILTPVSQNIFTTSNIRFIPVPAILTSTVGNNDNLKVFVNGVRLYEEVGAFTKTISGSNLTITFNSNIIGYNVETTAFEVAIIGKFIDL
jgi:hypothetical protein